MILLRKGWILTMVKVLIADDEPIILKGIYDSIDWEALDMQVVATAHDGKNTLAAIEKFSPDLCLLDLRMPAPDGLEVALRYKEKNPKGVVIFITGYDEFSYAQAAVKIGVFAYVLKPVNEEELLDTVCRAKQKILSQRSEDAMATRNSQLITQNQKELQQNFLQNWFAGNIPSEFIDEQLVLHDIKTMWPMNLLILRISSDLTLKDEFPHGLNAIEIDAIIDKALGDKAFYRVRDVQDYINILYPLQDDYKDWITQLEEHLHNANMRIGTQHFLAPTPASVPELITKASALLGEYSQLSPIVYRLVRYVEEYYANPVIRLGDFAEQNHVSTSHLSRQFSAEMQMSFSQFLNGYRIKHSLQYLKNPTNRISEIAEKVGYSSQHYFCEAFRKVTGQSPSEYRKNKS